MITRPSPLLHFACIMVAVLALIAYSIYDMPFYVCLFTSIAMAPFMWFFRRVPNENPGSKELPMINFKAKGAPKLLFGAFFILLVAIAIPTIEHRHLPIVFVGQEQVADYFSFILAVYLVSLSFGLAMSTSMIGRASALKKKILKSILLRITLIPSIFALLSFPGYCESLPITARHGIATIRLSCAVLVILLVAASEYYWLLDSSPEQVDAEDSIKAS